PDPSRSQLLELTREFTNSAEITGSKSFFTFHQNTQGGNIMATCLDYIFIDENQSHLVSKKQKQPSSW
ncbi:11884_t:CDS:2, partial [Cetraspora pellucida]